MNLHTAFFLFSVLYYLGMHHCESQSMSGRVSWTKRYTFRFIDFNKFCKAEIKIMPKTEDTRISIPCLNVNRQLLNFSGQSFNVTRTNCETVEIISTADISVHGMVFSSVGLSAGFLALPHDVLGTEYLVDCYTPISRSAQVAISAISEETTITIDCVHNYNCTFNNARVSGPIKLGAGESGILTGVENETEMTGTYIRADKPISVIVGALNVYIPRDSVYLGKEHGVILEQLQPISSWGIDHIVPPFQQTPNGWILRILAMNESTNIAMTDCGGQATASLSLDSKEYMDITFNGTSQNLVLIQANKPIQVMQYVASSPNKQGEDGDPSMTVIPAVRNYHGNTTVRVNRRTDNMRYFGDVVVLGEETPMLQLNGSEMNGTCYPNSSRPMKEPKSALRNERFCHYSTELQNGVYHVTHGSQSARFWVRLYTLHNTLGAAMLADIGVPASCLESVITGIFGTLNFPATPLDQTADSQERCSEYSNNTPLPRARRTCRGDLLSAAVWDDPVFQDCYMGEDTNEVLDNIARAVVTSENVTEYSNDVAEATANVADINAEGLRAISDALEKIVNAGNSSTEVTNNTFRIVDNALGAPDEEFVYAVEFQTSTRILDFLEQQVTLFQTQGDGNNLTIVGRSVAAVALQIPKASLLEGLGFATLASPDCEEKSNVLNELNENKTMVYFYPDNIPMTTIDATIVLPPDIIGQNGTVPVTFFIFQTTKLFLSPDQEYDLGCGRRLAVGTRVISATMEGAVIEGLPQGGEVETAFLELDVTRDSEAVDKRTCVFWDKIDQGGRWSSEGCRREDNPDINRIRCLCDHLTSFAVLLDVSGDVGLYVLDVLGLIGCIISIICLVITLVTYLSMKKLRSRQPQRILINLCFALLGLYLVFVIGIDRRYPTAGCVVVGILIHFFLLSSMSWMLVEAINMYLLFVKVLAATVSHFMHKAALFAYGMPLLVCIVTVAFDSSLYLGDGTYCFVKPGPALYYGVLLIVALLLAANFTIFGIVMQRLSCRKSVADNKTNQASRGEMWRRVQNAVAISALLGLTWLFGFLAIGGARLVFNILFLILNSLQGFLVFLMFCVRQKEVREQWVRWMHCGQRRSDDFVRAKYNKTGSQDGRTSLATSSSQGIQLSSKGTVSTDTTL